MSETIGQRLKKAREYRHLTLEKAAEVTRIRQGYLQALEADDFSAMPSPVQARGFLRNYAQYLELDLDRIVEELRAEHSEPEAETEVVFEGEQTKPAVEPEVSIPEGEDDSPDAGSSTEPFWQTWLRRVRSEAGEGGGEFTSQPGSEPAPVSEPEAITHEDIPSEVEVVPVIGSGSVEAEAEESPKPWSSFLDWANIHISRKQPDEPPAMDVETGPEPEPELMVEPVAAVDDMLSSQEIINEIGLQLRQRREMLSLTLDEIERHTRMRAQFMEALEKGNFDELPSPVQTRGMLTGYAGFLDLDVDAILLRFADALQTRHRERYPEKPARRRGKPDIPESLPTLRTFIAGDLVFGIGMALLLIAFSIWGISRVIAIQSEQRAEVQAEASGPSISEALIGTPEEAVVAEVTLIPAEDTPIPNLPEGTIEIPTPAANVNVQINIVAVERSYLQVTVDGEVAFDGRTIPGNAYPFDAEQSVEILAGNGAALRVVYNQRDLGLLGGFGQIARFIYTPDEILVPTPAVPPTATFTPYISPTPSITPSPTLTPTNTPTEQLD